jgi:hypothetical protein
VYAQNNSFFYSYFNEFYAIKYISVGGKNIAKNLIVAPFLKDDYAGNIANSPGLYRNKIKDIFIPVSINVDCTEISIDNDTFDDNNLNIVFIFDTEKNVNLENFTFIDFFSLKSRSMLDLALNNSAAKNYKKSYNFNTDFPVREFFFFCTEYASYRPFTHYKGSTFNVTGVSKWFETDTDISNFSLFQGLSWKKVKSDVIEETYKNLEFSFDLDTNYFPNNLDNNIYVGLIYTKT